MQEFSIGERVHYCGNFAAYFTLKMLNLIPQKEGKCAPPTPPPPLNPPTAIIISRRGQGGLEPASSKAHLHVIIRTKVQRLIAL